MLLGCIADDFTGASDLANTLAKGGMATVQFVGIPAGTEDVACEAGVVALKTRSIAAAEAVSQSLAALTWLQRQGCRQFLFKYCSTFDSTPHGNIGPVAVALLDALGADIAVVCPAFPETGRTLYFGHLFVQGRLLNESGMQDHPLNPMTDPDIGRWLRRQIAEDVGLVPYSIVRRGSDAVATALRSEAGAARRLVVVDAVTNEDLVSIGKAVVDHQLITGGSGVALGLPANFRAAGLVGGVATAFEPTRGPGIVLSGSCSMASAAQVAYYVKQKPEFRLDPDRLIEGEQTVEGVLDFACARIDQEPIIYSTADPASVSAAQQRHGREKVADAVEGCFGALARGLVERGVTRLVVGGGETAGAVVSALGLRRFEIGPEIDPGVPALAAGDSLRLALKSGNFGGVDFYAKALAALGRA